MRLELAMTPHLLCKLDAHDLHTTVSKICWKGCNVCCKQAKIGRTRVESSHAILSAFVHTSHMSKSIETAEHSRRRHPCTHTCHDSHQQRQDSNMTATCNMSRTTYHKRLVACNTSLTAYHKRLVACPVGGLHLSWGLLLSLTWTICTQCPACVACCDCAAPTLCFWCEANMGQAAQLALVP